MKRSLRLRHAGRCLQHAQIHGLQDGVHSRREYGIAIVHDEAVRRVARETASELLRRPRARRVFSDVPGDSCCIVQAPRLHLPLDKERQLLSAAFHNYGDAPRVARRPPGKARGVKISGIFAPSNAARRDASPAECHRNYERQHLV
jgi:hypothetical protein